MYYSSVNYFVSVIVFLKFEWKKKLWEFYANELLFRAQYQEIDTDEDGMKRKSTSIKT